MKLYEITGMMRDILLRLAEPLPDQSDPNYELARFERESAERLLAGTEMDMKEKLRAYVAVAMELKCEREARLAEIDRIEANVLAKMRAQCERDARKEEWLMDTAARVIAQFDVPLPIKYKEFTLSRRKQPGACKVLDLDAVPLEYTRLVPESREADKKKILADLRDGVVIPGCALSAESYVLTVR